MKRVLIIDDDRLYGAPETAVRAYTSAEAINRLSERSVWDEIWFDHDLGGDDTSMAVVEYLEQRHADDDPIWVGCVFVHSMNVVGAANLVRALSGMYPTRRIALPWRREARPEEQVEAVDQTS